MPLTLSVYFLTQLLLRSTFSVTSNSRMMYAFSRDGAIPGSSFFHKVDRRWRSPIRTGRRRQTIAQNVCFFTFHTVT
jgi:amino acid transporter